MTTETVGLIAAMPGEIRPLLKNIGRVEKEAVGPFTLYRFNLGGRPVCLVESGMGMTRATAATELLLARCSPAAIISFGFGGATLPGLKVGDIVVARRSLLFSEEGFAEQEGIAQEAAAAIAEKLAETAAGLGWSATKGEIITTAKIMNKGDMARLIPPGLAAPVLDMETTAVTAAAVRRGVPVVAIRAVSDGAGEELAFSIEEFTDAEMNIRPTRVLSTIARRPRIIPQLLRLAANTTVAGKNLALAVRTALDCC